MRLAHTAAAGVVTLLVLSATAHAATVAGGVYCGGPHGSCSSAFSFMARPGEANDVTTVLLGNRVRIRDTGAPLEAGPGCEQLGEHEANCTGAGGYFVIDTGDGDDRVTGP